MVQIGLAIVGIGLIAAAIRALAGNEKDETKTSRSVAIAMIIVGIAVIAFAFVGLPILMS